jgi:hypothetical protein
VTPDKLRNTNKESDDAPKPIAKPNIYASGHDNVILLSDADAKLGRYMAHVVSGATLKILVSG